MRKIRKLTAISQKKNVNQAGVEKPPEESGGFIIETKTNDCPSCDGREL
jgi:hypothetical protein